MRVIHSLIVIVAFLLPLFITLKIVLTGNIPFWYDNARDLLLAWDNLNKPTLIGPTSGIPGIFYGPYWIWLLSIGLLFSKDPRIPGIIVGILPYFTVFPLILFQFSKLFGKKIIVLIWLLFILTVGMKYITNMWNPHLAPLLFLILVYFLVFTNFTQKGWRTYTKLILMGFVAGLIINFHISFGIGVFFGTLLFFLIDFIRTCKDNKKRIKYISLNRLFLLVLFLSGLIISYIPFLLFEYRHGFHQLQVAIHALTKYGAVVSQQGLTKVEILQHFFGRPATLLQFNPLLVCAIELIVLAYFLIALKHNKLKLKENEKKLLIVLSTLSIGILFIYLTARNPVWDYHFIGTEVIFLLLIALVIRKFYILKYLLTAWVIFLTISSFISFTKSFNTPYAPLDLSTKEYITDTIARDAAKTSYTVFNYSPSIYQYDYSYLFKWRHHKDIPYDPSNTPANSKLIYLIIPPASEDAIKDFINYRTPNKDYKTSKDWKIADGTTIIKRVRVK
jgi:hypothetical protein